MNKYLIFRTDRIGDFLLSAILIKCIKRYEPSSCIKIVASEKNYDYIKTFNNIDHVFLLKKNIFEKVKLINVLKKDNFKAIIIHDQKKRSSLISFFLKYEKIIKNKVDDNDTYIDQLKKILTSLNMKFQINDLDILNFRNYNNKLNDRYVLFHFDEKWIHEKYIKDYTKIEPTKDELIIFFNLILKKTNKKLVISTGINPPKVLDDIFDNNVMPNISYMKNLTFIELENIISKSSILISCHGAVSHVAASLNIKQIDIIEENKSFFYKKWTDHFRNYNSIGRINFKLLTKQILSLL